MLVELANSMKAISEDRINADIAKLCTKAITEYINDLNKKLNPNREIHIDVVDSDHAITTNINVNGSTVNYKSMNYHPGVNVMLNTQIPRFMRISTNYGAATETTEGILNAYNDRYSYGIDIDSEQAAILFEGVDKEQLKHLDRHIHGTNLMKLVTTTPNDRLQAIEDAINKGLDYYHTFHADHRDTIKPYVDAGTVTCAVKHVREIHTASGPALMVATDWKKENWNDPTYTEFMSEAGKIKYATCEKTNFFPFFFFRNRFWTIGVQDMPRALKLYNSDGNYMPTSSVRWERPDQPATCYHQTFIMFDSTDMIKTRCKAKTLRRYGIN